MKAIILSILIFIGIECEAQEQFTSLEWNAGVSYIDDGLYFPGCSYLIGTTYITKSNLVLDAQIGLAFPTLATGKVGEGFRGKIAIIPAGKDPILLTHIFSFSGYHPISIIHLSFHLRNQPIV